MLLCLGAGRTGLQLSSGIGLAERWSLGGENVGLALMRAAGMSAGFFTS